MLPGKFASSSGASRSSTRARSRGRRRERRQRGAGQGCRSRRAQGVRGAGGGAARPQLTTCWWRSGDSSQDRRSARPRPVPRPGSASTPTALRTGRPASPQLLAERPEAPSATAECAVNPSTARDEHGHAQALVDRLGPACLGDECGDGVAPRPRARPRVAASTSRSRPTTPRTTSSPSTRGVIPAVTASAPATTAGTYAPCGAGGGGTRLRHRAPPPPAGSRRRPGKEPWSWSTEITRALPPATPRAPTSRTSCPRAQPLQHVRAQPALAAQRLRGRRARRRRCRGARSIRGAPRPPPAGRGRRRRRCESTCMFHCT